MNKTDIIKPIDILDEIAKIHNELSKKLYELYRMFKKS